MKEKHAQTKDPLLVILAFDDAMNAHDVDADMALLADDAVVTISGQPPTRIFTGKEQIRTILQSDAADNIHVDSRDRRVDGDKVTWIRTISTDSLQERGVDSITFTTEAVVQEGKIKSLTTTMTPESLAKLEASMVGLALDDAMNAHDLDAAIALFTDDAVARFPGQWPDVFTGKEGIRTWVQTDMANDIHVESRNFKVAGDKVTWTSKVSVDFRRKIGIALSDVTTEVVVQGGKIKSFTCNLVPESLAKLEVASVVPSFEEAMNTHDLEASLAFFTDDAIARFPGQAPGVFTGKEGIRLFLQEDIADKIHVDSTNFKVEGDKVTWISKGSWNSFRAMGIDLVDAVGEAVIQEGKIKLLTVTFTPESLANIEINRLQRELGRKYHFDNIIGRSTAIKWVYELMEKAIDSGLAVLISGETGTGKELVAKAIHYQSPRKDYPLIDLNCGAMPKELVASSLFGHRKGAFTSADRDRAGIFEAAEGGTVLLDEISEMPPEAQVHLLRVLQERKIQRIGESQSRDVDVRVIAMTNRDLTAEVKAGRFREDLYYRLNVFPIHIPALRERSEDIPLLAEHFLQKYRRQNKKDILGFGPGVMEMLQSYRWPGNVRELESAINYAAAFIEVGLRIQPYHFPPQITQVESIMQGILSERGKYHEMLSQFQRRIIENTLKTCSGNRYQAAKMLGMDRSNLVKLIKRLGLDKH